MLNKKGLYISIIGVLTVGLSGCGCLGCLSGCLPGCGCLFPSTPNTNTLENLHVELYREADDLLHEGKYRAAVEKYEQAFKIRPRRTNVIDVSYIAHLKYRIAFCYAKLAEAEDHVSLYLKAEAAVRESYQTAILQDDQLQILYLWGYVLFKQARYEEARAKYEEAIEIFLPESESSSLIPELYTLGIVYLELGDEANARQVFAQFLGTLKTPWRVRDPVGTEVLYRLGKAYMELGDEANARRAFAQLEALDYVGYGTMYRLGRAYMGLGDEAAAQRVFAQLERKIDATLQSESPDIEDELYWLGKTYMELDNEDSARRVFAELEAIIDDALQNGFPYIADELYLLGKAYMELGNEDSARRTFEQFLEHYPDSSYKTEVERLLEKQ